MAAPYRFPLLMAVIGVCCEGKEEDLCFPACERGAAELSDWLPSDLAQIWKNQDVPRLWKVLKSEDVFKYSRKKILYVFFPFSHYFRIFKIWLCRIIFDMILFKEMFEETNLLFGATVSSACRMFIMVLNILKRALFGCFVDRFHDSFFALYSLIRGCSRGLYAKSSK